MSALATPIASQQAAVLAELAWRADAFRVLNDLEMLVRRAPDHLEDVGAAFIAAHIAELGRDLGERVR